MNGVMRLSDGNANDQPTGFLVVILLAFTYLMIGVVRGRPRVSSSGLALLQARRSPLQRASYVPQGAEIPIAVALLGGWALWLADPELASAWSIPR